MRFEHTAEDGLIGLDDLRAELPDDLAELAEQLSLDAQHLARRYPAETPGLWWDRAQEAEAAAAAQVQPASTAAAPAAASAVKWNRTALASVAVALLVLAGGWWTWQQQDDAAGNRGPANRTPSAATPFGPALAGGGHGLALPGAVLPEATPASWTPEAYPDVSGEEEQVLHDELKLIRSAEL